MLTRRGFGRVDEPLAKVKDGRPSILDKH